MCGSRFNLKKIYCGFYLSIPTMYRDSLVENEGRVVFYLGIPGPYIFDGGLQPVGSSGSGTINC